MSQKVCMENSANTSGIGSCISINNNASTLKTNSSTSNSVENFVRTKILLSHYFSPSRFIQYQSSNAAKTESLTYNTGSLPRMNNININSNTVDVVKNNKSLQSNKTSPLKSDANKSKRITSAVNGRSLRFVLN